MDNVKIGQLIYRLRKEKQLTQLQLANQMNISDKTISKWERGLGCPELSLLTDLSEIFNVDLEKFLSGELNTNEVLGGNMKNLNFYICPTCGNMLTGMGSASAYSSFCSRKITVVLYEARSFLSRGIACIFG